VTRSIATVLVVLAAITACRPAERGPLITQPGAPGQPSRVITPEQATDLTKVQFTGDDVKFMQGMIGHHAQAIEMTELLATRTASAGMKKLALRIEVSQQDEIRMMENWLEARHQRVPSRTAMHEHGATLMPGMLSEAEMQQLADSRGVEFDRLFLQGMIKHHGGALEMVKNLFDSPGAGQDNVIFTFASDVDADQRIEIDRMSAMLSELQK
jgi:uncharacterized protein (DUF305 family)